jgi:anti-anti-sigma factor
MAHGTPEVSPGDHACCTFATDDDQAEMVGRFVRDAAQRRDRVFYLADRSDESQVADYVSNAGLDGRAMLDSGALQVLHSSQMDLADGFDRNRQLVVWRQLTAAARDDGYRGLAALAEMSWALSRNVDLDALIDYEETSDPVFISGELSAICQYDRRLFDDEMLARAGHAHRYAMKLGDAGCTVDNNRLRVHLGRILELGGEIDLANVHFLDQVLAERLAEADAVVDCTTLSFIDAGGCRVLRSARNGELGEGRLTLRNTPEVVERVMKIFDGVERAG